MFQLLLIQMQSKSSQVRNPPTFSSIQASLQSLPRHSNTQLTARINSLIARRQHHESLIEKLISRGENIRDRTKCSKGSNSGDWEEMIEQWGREDSRQLARSGGMRQIKEEKQKINYSTDFKEVIKSRQLKKSSQMQNSLTKSKLINRKSVDIGESEVLKEIDNHVNLLSSLLQQKTYQQLPAVNSGQLLSSLIQFYSLQSSNLKGFDEFSLLPPQNHQMTHQFSNAFAALIEYLDQYELWDGLFEEKNRQIYAIRWINGKYQQKWISEKPLSQEEIKFLGNDDQNFYLGYLLLSRLIYEDNNQNQKEIQSQSSSKQVKSNKNFQINSNAPKIQTQECQQIGQMLNKLFSFPYRSFDLTNTKQYHSFASFLSNPFPHRATMYSHNEELPHPISLNSQRFLHKHQKIDAVIEEELQTTTVEMKCAGGHYGVVTAEANQSGCFYLTIGKWEQNQSTKPNSTRFRMAVIDSQNNILVHNIVKSGEFQEIKLIAGQQYEIFVSPIDLDCQASHFYIAMQGHNKLSLSVQLKQKYNQFSSILINQYITQFHGFDLNKLMTDATHVNKSKPLRNLSQNPITVHRYHIDFLDYIIDCIILPPNIDTAKISYSKSCLTDQFFNQSEFTLRKSALIHLSSDAEISAKTSKDEPITVILKRKWL